MINNSDNNDDSRAHLYYASVETIVSPSEQNDLYGRIIEKKRVRVEMLDLIMLCFIVKRTLCFSYAKIRFVCRLLLVFFCFFLHRFFCFFARLPKLQRQSSLCHSCRYTRIHHVPSFHTTSHSQIKQQESSFIKTTNSTNLTDSLSSSSLVAANAASTLSSAAAAATDTNSNDFISSNHCSSTSSLPFSILNGDSGVYGSRISITDDVYEQLCEKPQKAVSFSSLLCLMLLLFN